MDTQPPTEPPPARVVLVTTYFWPVIGGVEKNARQVVEALNEGGVGVTVLTRRTPPQAPHADRIAGVDVVRLPPAGPRSAVGKWGFVPIALFELLRRGRHYDGILCIDFRGTGFAAVFAGKLLGRPVVLQAATPGALSCANWDGQLAAAGIAPDGWLGRAIKWPARRTYASADAYVCVAHDVEREALACGIPARKLTYIPHGVDVKRFLPPSAEERAALRTQFGWTDTRRVVLFVGRLSREKGPLDLLEAWRRLGRRDARLVLVGPEMPGHHLDAGPAARRFVAEHGLADSVTFFGPASDPAPLLRAADLFVQPSHYEAFGLSALEALASGLPIVATGVGGLRDFLTHEATALLCDPARPDLLATAIARLLDDPALAARLGARGRLVADTGFGEKALGEKYRQLFHLLLTEVGRGSPDTANGASAAPRHR